MGGPFNNSDIGVGGSPSTASGTGSGGSSQAGEGATPGAPSSAGPVMPSAPRDDTAGGVTSDAYLLAVAARHGVGLDERFRDAKGCHAARASRLRELRSRLLRGESLRLMCWCAPRRCVSLAGSSIRHPFHATVARHTSYFSRHMLSVSSHRFTSCVIQSVPVERSHAA
jgi:hypothetical protein